MKTLYIGDIHGRSVWKLITQIEKPDRVIFLGDYFDSFNISGIEQMHNFEEIIEYKKSGQAEMIMLIGNHDYHYFPEVGNQGYSGYQHNLAMSISHLLNENRDHLQMAYMYDTILCTHAGVSSKFMDNVYGKDGWMVLDIANKLNETWKYKPRTFDFGAMISVQKFSYTDPYGDNEDQSPIWIRPKSLMRVNKETLRKFIIQIHGHTEVRCVDIKGGATGGRYYNIDCLETSGEYLIRENGKFSTKSWKSDKQVVS